MQHLHRCRFGFLSQRASRVILGRVDPHHLKCHSGRGRDTCSGRPHASVDRTGTRDYTREFVFVLTDDTHMRQFSTFFECGDAKLDTDVVVGPSSRVVGDRACVVTNDGIVWVAELSAAGRHVLDRVEIMEKQWKP